MPSDVTELSSPSFSRLHLCDGVQTESISIAFYPRLLSSLARTHPTTTPTRILPNPHNVQKRNLHHLPYVLSPSLVQNQTNPSPPLPEKSSWWGCGSHVQSVMDPLPKDTWCTCEPKTEVGGTKYPPMAAKAD